MKKLHAFFVVAAAVSVAVGVLFLRRGRVPATDSSKKTEEPSPIAPPIASSQTRPKGPNVFVGDWQKERVTNIAQETIPEVVAHLANFDDFQFATTYSGRGFSEAQPRSVNGFLPHLFRVRRLLEESRIHRDIIVETMRETLQQALAEWPEAFQLELAFRIKTQESFTKTAPTKHDILRVQAEAATYILAEIKDWESLPVLMESYARQKQWIDAIPVDKYRYLPQCPVPPPLTLYAMHRLINAYPTGKLSPSALRLRSNYLKWTDAHLPQPTAFDAVSSASLHDESDVLNGYIDPGGMAHANEPRMSLLEYPYAFVDGTEMLGYPAAPYISDQSQEWFGLIKAFCDATNE